MISIVIPVFNEEENVSPLFLEIKEEMTKLNLPYEVLFVNDGSNDATLYNLKKLLKGEGKGILRIIDLQRNSGQTPALLAGFASVKGELVITMDGDLQNDPKDIPKLIEALTDEYDVICGWRKNRKDNILKKFPSKFNNLINRKLNKISIHDSGCTIRIYRREAIENVQLFAEGHRYIPAVLANKGFRIGEIITHHRPRTLGRTKYGFKRLFRGFIDLFTLGVIHKWGKKPIHLFSLWALIFTFTGFNIFIWALLERVAFHRFWSAYQNFIELRNNPLLFISLGLCMFGFLLLLLGFIAEILLRTNSDSHNSYKIKKEWS